MSKPQAVQQLATLLRARWEIPVALLAVIVASTTLYHLMPGGVEDFDLLLAEIEALEQGGNAIAAADALANLLEMEPPLDDTQRAIVHDRLADLIYRQELKRDIPNLANVELLLHHHDAANELFFPAGGSRYIREARAAEWIGNRARATSAYRSALEFRDELDAPEERIAMQGLVRQLQGQPGTERERQQLLEGLLAHDSASDGYTWWALRRSLELALDEGDTLRARLVLGKHGDRLKTSDLKGYWDYLWAWIMVHEGRTDEATPIVHWIEDWLEQRDTADDLDSFGHLPALNRWLLGRIHLAEHRPQEALATFGEALALNPDGDLFVATTAGRAEALAMLERHQTAREVFRQAVDRLQTMPETRQRGTERLRETLIDLFRSLRAKQNFADALAYLELAAALTPATLEKERRDLLTELGDTYLLAAEATDRETTARDAYENAGRCLEEAAELCAADEARQAALLWSSAQGYDRAGRIAAVRRVLERFLRGRSEDPRLPQAFLQLGQAYEADGRYEEALAWYDRLINEFPTLQEAPRARLLSVGCLLALGREREAEARLLELLDGNTVSPEAVVFHDALLELCDLLYQRGAYAQAISRLENFATLYPDDPENMRSRFILADAYRRSAYALREDPPEGADPYEVRVASRERFARAAELFGELSGALSEAEPGDASRLYDRLALFYHADCLFELNERDTLLEALETYQRAAARYERQPAALTAQVQIANIFLRLGRLTEAARSLERARWLLRNIPDRAFEADLDGADRAHWDRYLTAIVSSELFEEVFAGNP